MALRAYYRSHISKTIDIAVMEIDFGDGLDNGGGAINLVYKELKVPKLDRKSFGKNGIVIKNKGDIHFVDCNVTGSNDVI